MNEEGTAQPSPAIPIEIARELARQGEARLNALMALATAGDLRATTLTGIFGAGAVAMGAAVLAYLASEHALVRLILSGGIVSIGFFMAAAISAIAGAPRNFFIAGGNPDILRQWSWAEGKWRTEVEMLDATACRYANLIADNRRILEGGSKRVQLALWVGLFTPISGVISFFAVNLPHI